ncbi:fibronectin type III domain-containing protein [Streptomyces chumphonensis]|uniref:fibronectin type III domain-containing protein n=1 Tax=Streptomyces chumphonensis TaxID=1214925 RepID=UPI003D70271E
MARRHSAGRTGGSPGTGPTARTVVAALALALTAGVSGSATARPDVPAEPSHPPVGAVARDALPASGPQAAPAPPAPPQDLTVRAVDSETVRLRWEPPYGAGGGSAVATYQVFQQGTATPVAEVGADTLEAEITGLEPGISYTFTVRAVNAAGHASPDSPRADVILPGRG